MYSTKNFKFEEFIRSETAIRKNISNMPDTEQETKNIIRCMDWMQRLRDDLGKPIHINSCYRNLKINTLVGGSRTSAHKSGLAIDFVVMGMPVSEVCHFIMDSGGNGGYQYDQLIYEFGSWTHVGIPGAKCRMQALTATKQGRKTVYIPGIK